MYGWDGYPYQCSMMMWKWEEKREEFSYFHSSSCEKWNRRKKRKMEEISLKRFSPFIDFCSDSFNRFPSTTFLSQFFYCQNYLRSVTFTLLTPIYSTPDPRTRFASFSICDLFCLHDTRFFSLKMLSSDAWSVRGETRRRREKLKVIIII